MDVSIVENKFAGNYQAYYSRFLPDLKKIGSNEMTSICPFHTDRHPSFFVNNINGLYHCFGCQSSGNMFSFYAKMHDLDTRTDFPKILKDISTMFGISQDDHPDRTNVKTRYDYLDATGTLKYQIERLDPKSFRIRRPDENGGWVYDKKDLSIIPYHLPEIMKSSQVIVVEGEKDADNLVNIGLTATTNPFGAGKWPDDFGPYFDGKNVILIPDNDAVGIKHMHKVAENLKSHAVSIKWINLPDIPEKGDVSDFISQFTDKEAAAERLAMMIDDAPLYEDKEATLSDESERDVDGRRGFHFISAAELLSSPKPIDWLIRGYLDANSLSMVFGDPGSMKTFLALDLGLCVATSIPWHGHTTDKSGPVFYIAGEGFMGLSRRLRAWEIAHAVCLQDVPFFVSDRPAQFLDAESAAEVIAAVEELKDLHGNPVLIIIDTLNRNFGPGNESDTADMTKFVSVIDKSLRCRYQCSVLIVHHTGLTEKHRARGSYSLNGALDWEYRLSKGTGEIRTLTNTKVKDHEAPPPIDFRPEIIELDGWVDQDNGELMTSCLLRRVEVSGSVWEQHQPLAGAKKTAFDALLAAIDASGELCPPEMGLNAQRYVHADFWRKQAYSSGITTSTSQASKKKAFQRAVSDLQHTGWVETKNDYWWPATGHGTGTGH